MPLISLTAQKTVRRLTRPPPRDETLLEQATALAEEGQHEASTMTVFRYLLRKDVPSLRDGAYTFVQGSSQVTAALTGDELTVRVPVVKVVPGGTEVALLRYVLSWVAQTGQLFQPRLKGEELVLEFKDALPRLHPNKLHEVLRSIAFTADDLDDYLIGEFGAQPLRRAAIAPLSDAEATLAERAWRAHWSEIEELCREANRKRSLFFLNAVTALARHRATYAVPLSGQLGARLATAARTFQDTSEEALKREGTLARFAKEMRAVTAAELRASLGHAEYALSPVKEGEAQHLADFFGAGEYRDDVDRMRSGRQAMDAAVSLFATYNYLLAAFSWPEELSEELEEALGHASNRPWRDAANVLFDAGQDLLSRWAEDEEGEGDGEEEEEGDGEEAGEGAAGEGDESEEG